MGSALKASAETGEVLRASSLDVGRPDLSYPDPDRFQRVHGAHRRGHSVMLELGGCEIRVLRAVAGWNAHERGSVAVAKRGPSSWKTDTSRSSTRTPCATCGTYRHGVSRSSRRPRYERATHRERPVRGGTRWRGSRARIWRASAAQTPRRTPRFPRQSTSATRLGTEAPPSPANLRVGRTEPNEAGRISTELNVLHQHMPQATTLSRECVNQIRAVDQWA